MPAGFPGRTALALLGVLGVSLAVVGGIVYSGSDGGEATGRGPGAGLVCRPGARFCIAPEADNGTVVLPAKTPYWHARLSRDSRGLLRRIAPNGAHFRNVSSVAFDIAQEGRDFGLADGCVPLPMTPHRTAGLDWAERHARDVHGAAVWAYDYDTQVNDVLLKAGWPSAFAQDAVVTRLLMAYCATGAQKYLDLARRGGKALLLPVGAGGVRSQNENFVWFQEIPIEDRYAPFIVNAHLYSIFTLLVLHRMSPGAGFAAAAKKGLRSLDAALPVIDDGYWNRYDLRPRYMAMNFLIRTHGAQLRSAVLSIGDAKSSIDRTTRIRHPAGNTIWNASDDNPRRLALQFILPSLRRFDPSLLHAVGRLRVRVRCCVGRVGAYALGMRPGRNEYYKLERAGESRGGADQKFDFTTSLRDYSWGQVAPEYLPFDASLMALIARLTGRQDYLVYAYRWEDFYRNWRRGKGPAEAAPVLKTRFAYAPSPRLANHLARVFGYRLPGSVSEAQLRQAVESMPEGSAGPSAARISMLETLALRPAR
ncbi:MAG TPA: D-glucuronyl C5-epimerase family protein [Stellaceae bacterium]|nr:D-glucuronyl C5-epimerase family protein [Stellaceae bacterium]